MKRIICRRIGENYHVGFADYRMEHQLKDLYKLFKKASGYLVQEYVSQDGATTAITSNSNSIRIAWNEELGCHAFSSKADRMEFMQILFRMLCYRYNSYGKFKELFEKMIRAEAAGESGSIDMDSGYMDSDYDIISDINGILNVRGE